MFHQLLTLDPDMPPNDQLQLLTNLFKEYCDSRRGVQIPADFLPLTLAAMEHLKKANRSNIVYQLSKAVGTKRPDVEECRWGSLSTVSISLIQRPLMG